MSLNGDLKSVSLWEVLEILSFSRKTGRLQLTHGSKKTDVYFEEGRIKHIKADNCEDNDAILGLALWKEGNFAFFPDEKAPKTNLNLDPLHILVDVSKDIDLIEYLGDLIFLFINIANLTDEEKNVGLLFDGLKPTKEIILNSSYGEAKTLRIIEKLRKNRNLLRIDENLNLFWSYTFWRYFIFTLEKENERDFRKKWTDTLNKMSSTYKLAFELLTRDKKVEWFNIFPLIREVPSSEFFPVVRDAFYFIESYRKLEINNVIDTGKILFLSQELEPYMDKVYVPIKHSEIIEENIVLWSFDGKRVLREIIDILPFGELRKLQLVKAVMDKKLILTLGDNLKLDFLNYFFNFWQDILIRIEKKGKAEEFKKEWDKFIYESLSDVKHLFSHLTFETKPNFPYFYKNIAKSQEDELRAFLREAIKVVYDFAEKVLSKEEIDEAINNVLQNVEKFSSQQVKEAISNLLNDVYIK
jgi:hypothetical protein